MSSSGLSLTGVMFFLWLNPVRLYSLHEILYPKTRIESYSILGTIVSQNKIPLTPPLILREHSLAALQELKRQGLGFRVQGLGLRV